MSLVEADKYAEAMHSFNVQARDDPRTQAKNPNYWHARASVGRIGRRLAG